MQARAIALGAAAFAGVAAGVTLFGPSITAVEAEPGPAGIASAGSPTGGTAQPSNASLPGDEDDDNEEEDDDDDDNDEEDSD